MSVEPVDDVFIGSAEAFGSAAAAAGGSAESQRARNRTLMALEKRPRSKKARGPARETPTRDDEGAAGDGADEGAAGDGADDLKALEKYRQFDVLVRWDAFLYASNKNFDALIREVWGSNIQPWENVYQEAKQKMQNNVKAYKNQVLKAAEVSLNFKLSTIRTLTRYRTTFGPAKSRTRRWTMLTTTTSSTTSSVSFTTRRISSLSSTSSASSSM